jgi:8-oxo-dGTP pyrophosphatase MutT (NUDIX family)
MSSINFFLNAARRSNFAERYCLRDKGTLKAGVQYSPASMSNPSKVTAAKRVQYGALPYRLSAGSRPQFMLITSRETRRWVIPKGWLKKGKSPQYSAAREAFEEAGVVGAVAKRSVGSFSYEKRLKNGGVVVCEVRVFPLEVRRQNKQWPEKRERVVKWLPASQAAEKVKEPMLGEIGAKPVLT